MDDARILAPLIFTANFIWAMFNLAVVWMIRNLLGAKCLLPYKPDYQVKNEVVRQSLWWLQFPLLAVAGHRLYMNFVGVGLLMQKETIPLHHLLPLSFVLLWIYAAHRTLLPWAGVNARVFRLWIWGYLVVSSVLGLFIFDLVHHWEDV